MKRLSLQAAIALLFAGSAAHAVDLAAVYQNAKAYDATYAAASASFEASKERVVQAKGQFLPQVGLSSTYSGSTATSQASLSSSIGITQTLFETSKIVGKSQALVQAQQDAVNFRAAEQDLIIRVAQAYFDVLLAQDSLEFVRAQKNAVSEQLAQAKKTFEVGSTTITDTNDAQARYDGILAQEIAAENELLVKQAAFQQTTGMAAENLAPLGTRQQAQLPEPADVAAWIARANDSSPQILAKRAGLEVATLEIEKSRAIKQPSLTLSSGYTKTHQFNSPTLPNGMSMADAMGGGSQRGMSVTLNLNVPLYTGGVLSSVNRQAMHQRDAAGQDLEATTRQVALNTKQAFLGVKASAAQIKAYEQALVSAQTNLDSTRLGKDVGVRTSLDVLNVLQSYYQTKRDLSNARYQYELNRLRLGQAVGTLSQEDVSKVNAQLGG
ncbi:TolC family outer membrane protein [Burkholderiaceae bacterium DAT-1]|nr:TolC family outer membrane protein [Burkholderiaceae bacterium DAT-1]